MGKKSSYTKEEDKLLLDLYYQGYTVTQIHIKLKELGILKMPISIGNRLLKIKKVSFEPIKKYKK